MIAVLPVTALVAAGLAAGSTGHRPAPAAAVDTARSVVTADYVNYVAPRGQKPVSKDRKVGDQPTRGEKDALTRAQEVDRKYAGGNPKAARQLARLEQAAIRTGKSPRQLKQAKAKQDAKLLTLLVEFSDEADDDFTGVMVPASVFGDRTCQLGTVQNGPLHNSIPDPSTFSHLDNNTFWVPDFSPQLYDDMLYSKAGITQRVRLDLTGPDGRPGFDISGYTMRNMYEEMSKGAYTVSGAASEWITVPHSEAWYGADRCALNGDGEWEAGDPQTTLGHPDNPDGLNQLALDAVTAMSQQQPDFPWADYDIEDQFDRDDDGNFFEKDGYVDHLVLVHAGEDKSGDGGDQGTYAIWAQSSTVPGGGVEVPGTGVKIENYIIQPEDSGVGVFAHEYGHDLGLPDLYDTSSGGDSDVDFWDLMSSGSHAGPIFQSLPTHMGLWDKFVLGWADPKTLDVGAGPQTLTVGQSSRTPVGTNDGLRINLPTKVVTLTTPNSGPDMWWTGNDQDWADLRLTRTVNVPSGTSVKFWMQNDYVIEEDWDYGFVEVSTDGSTWTQLPVHDSAGAVVSSAPGFDPNGRLHDYGDLVNGLTGSSDGWQHQYVDLTSYQGTAVQLRLRYATDAAFQERGWFSEDFALDADGAMTAVDEAAGWTATVSTFTNTTGPGWRRDTGTTERSHYYLAEWRNFDGFDKGLRYTYDTSYANDAWKVERVAYNAPGLLVWYRDTTYGNQNPVLATTYDLPSTGTKGGLLVVDSHFDPLRRQGVAADKDPSTLNNLPSRPQSSNAAFTLQGTYPFRECYEAAGEPFSEYCTAFGSLPAVSTFSDAKTWYPGLEVRGEDLFFRDIDASVVVPSKGNSPYSTRVVDADGVALTELYGLDLGAGIVLGSGNPGDEGVAFGVTISLLKAAKDNTSAVVRVTAAPKR